MKWFKSVFSGARFEVLCFVPCLLNFGSLVNLCQQPT